VAGLSCPECETEWAPNEVYCPGCAQSVSELKAAAARAARPAPEETDTWKLNEPAPAAAPAVAAGLAFPWGVQEVAPGAALIVGREHPPLAAQLSVYPGVGRAHASLEHRDGSLYVTDLESTNGTLVDGRKLAADVPERLWAGQQVGFGMKLKATVI
jgi:hypothetical protein